MLRGGEHHHLRNVARIKPGEKIWLIDASGQHHLARVDLIEKTQTQLSILETKKKITPRVRVTLTQALIKAKKFELIIQKATELGIWEFQPVIAERSVVKIDDRHEAKLARWANIAKEACKQSGVSQIPDVLQPKRLADVLQDRREVLKISLNESGGIPLRRFLLLDTIQTRSEILPASLCVLIGPEGGWTEAEEEAIVSHGFEAISLGRQILRAETAAISSLAMIDHFWNQDHVS